MVLILGPHISVSDGLKKAIKNVKSMKGNAMQIFTGPPQSFELGKMVSESNDKLKKIDKFRQKEDMKIVIHSKYILNFSKPLIPKNKIFLVRFVQDLNFSKKIGAFGVVLHFGTATHGITRQEAVINMAKSLTSCIEHAEKGTTPILETSSGEGAYIGRTIESMNEVYRLLSPAHQRRIKFCIDTCHIFVSGYAIHKPGGFTKYIRDFEEKIGKNKIAVIHLNDSRTPYDGKNDRHEEIGKGYIFNPEMGGSLEALKEIVSYADKKSIPMILETHQNFPEQIQFIKRLMKNKMNGGGKNLREELIDRFTELMDIHKALGNIHQFQAYKNVVNKLKLFKKDIKTSKNVADLEGFGKGILSKIDEYAESGKIAVLNELRSNKKVYAQYELQKVYGIGPAFAKKLIEQNINNISELRDAFNNGRISLSDNQILGLRYYEDLNSKIKKKDAIKIVDYLKKILGVDILLMGGFRLGKESGKDLDLVVVNKKGMTEKILEKMEKIGIVKGIFDRGMEGITLLLKVPSYSKVVHVDFRFSDKKTLPFYTLYFGSGENFSRKIRQHAKDLGYKLNEKGLFRLKNGSELDYKFNKEEDIFKFLELEYVKPDDRLTYQWK